MKVYGGLIFVNGKQVRAIVSAKSLKRASELTGVKYNHMRGYWCETGNDIELKIATASPETVFIATSASSKEFTPLVKNTGPLR